MDFPPYNTNPETLGTWTIKQLVAAYHHYHAIVKNTNDALSMDAYMSMRDDMWYELQFRGHDESILEKTE